MPRQFAPGQHAELWIHDLDTGERRLRWRSDELLFEAPNWTADGRWLVINGDGRLWRLEADGDEDVLEPIPGPASPVNNDHVLHPDGCHLYASADDGHIHRVPLPGTGGEVTRVTRDDGLHHYLHGISPDGTLLAWIALRIDNGRVLTDVAISRCDGTGETLFVTRDEEPDDGSEWTPDGRWLWFNSELASSAPGHAQLFRLACVDGEPVGDPEQMTHGERVNWFPHPSPDGRRLVYVSYPPGTTGHPENTPVIIRELLADGATRDLAELFGGQGAMNVNSWAPDSRRIAYVNYSTV